MSAPRATGWRSRIPAGWTARELLVRVVAVGLGGFVLAYLAVWLLFFPSFGRGTVVTVPDFRAHTLREAVEMAEDAGVKVIRGSTLVNPRIAAGRVLAQSPLPGQEVTRGENVQVILSSGPERHPVPSLTGLGWKDAQALLVRLGFQVRIVRATNSAPEGRILRVTPAPRTTVPVPSVVEILVSNGPPKILAPGVVGITPDEAAARLEAAGLRLGRITYDSTSAGVPGSIVAQRPAEGDSIRQGSGVAVTVAGSDPDPPAPEPAPDSTAAPAEGEPVPAEPAEPTPAPPAPPAESRGAAAPQRNGTDE